MHNKYVYLGVELPTLEQSNKTAVAYSLLSACILVAQYIASCDIAYFDQIATIQMGLIHGIFHL